MGSRQNPPHHSEMIEQALQLFSCRLVRPSRGDSAVFLSSGLGFSQDIRINHILSILLKDITILITIIYWTMTLCRSLYMVYSQLTKTKYSGNIPILEGRKTEERLICLRRG